MPGSGRGRERRDGGRRCLDARQGAEGGDGRRMEDWTD